MERTCSADALIACESRHASWFSNEARALLVSHRVARVAADPPCAPDGGEPGGWGELVYYRFHGSPRVYYSNYEDAQLKALSVRMDEHRSRGVTTWCIFDNTAAQAGMGNALALTRRVKGKAL